MPNLFQKLASAIARPFTKHLLVRMDDDARRNKEGIKILREDSKKGFRAEREMAKELLQAKELIQNTHSRLIEHSRYTADSLDQLAERLDGLTIHISRQSEIQMAQQMAQSGIQIAQGGRLDDLALLQSGLSERQDLLLKRVHFALDDRRALIRTNVGYMICDRKDSAIVACLLDCGDLELGLRMFLGRYLVEGMTFVDVGANIGMHTIAAAKIVGRAGKVFSFEATPDTADFLRQNVLQNGVGGWTTVQECFVGATPGVTEFHLCPMSGHNSKFSLPNETQKIELPVICLDDALSEVKSVDLIKVDVEGAELEVFAGMKNLMQRSPEACVIAEFAAVHLERGGTSLENWDAFCAEHKLDIYIVDEHDGIVHKSSFAELMSEPSVNVLMARGSHFKQKLVSKQI